MVKGLIVDGPTRGGDVGAMHTLDVALPGPIGAVAGTIPTSHITSGQPNAAQGLELSVISACVLGG